MSTEHEPKRTAQPVSLTPEMVRAAIERARERARAVERHLLANARKRR